MCFEEELVPGGGGVTICVCACACDYGGLGLSQAE